MRRVHDAWIWPLLHRGLRLGPVAVMGHVGSCSFLLLRLPASTISDTPSFLSIFYPSSQIHFSDYKSDSPPFKKKKKEYSLGERSGKENPSHGRRSVHPACFSTALASLREPRWPCPRCPDLSCPFQSQNPCVLQIPSPRRLCSPPPLLDCTCG